MDEEEEEAEEERLFINSPTDSGVRGDGRRERDLAVRMVANLVAK